MFTDQSKKNQKSQGSRLSLEEANSITQSIVAKLGYPCEIFSSEASYEEVMDAYERAVQQGRQEGFTPVLVPADDVLEEYFGILKDDKYSLEDALASELQPAEEVLRMDDPEYMETLGEIIETEFCGEAGDCGEDSEDDDYEDEDYEDDDEDDEDGDDEDGYGDDDDEDDYDVEEIDSYCAFEAFGTDKIKETILLKVPTTKPWELVAYVPFGGWNECPGPEDMMSICKHWYEKYGAVPVTISHDIMEMHVPTPVAEEDSMQVAKEHFAFCPDRVFQGTETGTLNELAACIAASEIWFFWWD